MKPGPRVFVTGIGVVCAGANSVAELCSLLASPVRDFRPPTVFQCQGESANLPVAEAAGLDAEEASDIPRTHRLALVAAREAIGAGPAPDAIVLGTTTGGILTSETALKAGIKSPDAFRYHGLDTVALHLAKALDVHGPVLTLSTACSSAAVAMSVAHALLRAGLARRVLAGGADSLCRLTFHGFRALQLLAPEGCRPLDAKRAGMTVGEGAGFLVLETAPDGRPVLALLSGTGLSCDAYHASSPHPEGTGAAQAMRRALEDAGIEPSAVDYVNLHGTGTIDNDATEAKAIQQVFGSTLPPLSSTKGLTGHPLAAAGAIEAVISIVALTGGLLPANTGLGTADPSLGLAPVRHPTHAPIGTVLSNSFGFGGNNACLVLQAPTAQHLALDGRVAEVSAPSLPALRIAGSACLTAKGGLDDTWNALAAGQSAAGFVSDAVFSKAVQAAFVRRLKRLPRLVLALAQTAHAASGEATPPEFVAVGTAWGPLAETQDFLRKLFETAEQFSSPTDFIGSVHNAPAGQVALLLGATAPNLTCSAGDRSFAQALLCASLGLAAGKASALVLAAEAHEARLSPLFDERAATGPLASDGGAAFLLVRDDALPGARMRWLGEHSGLEFLEKFPALKVPARYDAVLVSVPASIAPETNEQVGKLTKAMSPCPLVAIRDRIGQHASVSATAAALAARAVIQGALPFAHLPIPLPHKRLLLLELGPRIAAIEVFA
jgi:3-oxoacyl-(acyl-carrier-protein) synthase